MFTYAAIFSRTLTIYYKSNDKLMDFMTAFPYIGVLILVVINALLVKRQDIHLEEKNTSGK